MFQVKRGLQTVGNIKQLDSHDILLILITEAKRVCEKQIQESRQLVDRTIRRHIFWRQLVDRL